MKTYVLGTVVIEESGKKIAFRKNPELIPDELLKAFEEDLAFKKSFYALTAGQQEGYVIYFLQPRQPQTRIGRIEKCKQQIFDGIGLNDKYSY
ncbi:MAG TPA: YdeI/OmpD-associated family protein [Flavitalea sp.]|nr:YdeI/OmpD-associated family protein [Flavitalea sp.]